MDGPTSTNAMQVASALPRNEGLVLDFDLQNTTDMVLQSDQTYVVTNSVNLDNVVIEGGTVVKYAPGASLTIGSVQCLTGPYRPAIFTAVDDNSVGDTISGSTGSPSGTYADCALSLAAGGDLKYVNIRYANEAIYCINNNYSLSHAQILNCNRGLHTEYADFWNGNILAYQVGTLYYGSFFNGRAEHLTCDQASHLVEDWDPTHWVDCGRSGDAPSVTLTLVNSVTAAIGNGYGNVPVTTDHVQDFYSSDGLFQTAGASAHYLPPDSPCRGAGTNSIQPDLAAALRTKTTSPPLVYSNVVISVDTTLGPQAQRDTTSLDIGFHYDIIDHAFNWVRVTNSTLRLLPGTSIATFGAYGAALMRGSQLICEGTATSPNRIVRYNMVQECANTNWDGAGSSVVGDWLGGTPSPQASFRFTDWSLPAHAQGCYHFSTWGVTVLDAFTDCQFHGGSFKINAPGFAITNCLFERVETTITDDNVPPLLPVVRNCLFLGGAAHLTHNNSDTWLFRDNAFDQTAITQEGEVIDVDGAYNAYNTTNRLQPTSLTDVLVTNFNWQASWLGNYYLPGNSSLINTGSVTNAGVVGLYQYTTQAGQAKETNSVVDIGFHYVAVDANGSPVDTDADGIPDYLEDRNGNGVADSGESDWQLYNSPNGLNGSRPFQVFTPLR